MAIITYLRRHTMLSISLGVALLSMCLVPPDSLYAEYLDYQTLTCLFCILAILCAFREIQLFPILATQLVQRVHTTRSLVLLMVWVTAISAMLIANDMSLLLFLPLCAIALCSTGNQQYILPAFLLQNMAANLGGMLTPFGSPQNLYLYSNYHIPTLEFFQILSLPFVASMLLLTLGVFFLIPATPLTLRQQPADQLPRTRTCIYTLLFLATVLVVFRVMPYWVILIAVPAVLLFADAKALRDTDWALLGTFVAFFIFSGNLARIPAVRELFCSWMQTQPLLTAIASSQLISNVPAAILLSRFTENVRPLLLGVNIGGVGTLISSLANLITLQEYGKVCPNDSKRFLLHFTVYNIVALALLTLVGWFWC